MICLRRLSRDSRDFVDSGPQIWYEYGTSTRSSTVRHWVPKFLAPTTFRFKEKVHEKLWAKTISYMIPTNLVAKSNLVTLGQFVALLFIVSPTGISTSTSTILPPTNLQTKQDRLVPGSRPNLPGQRRTQCHHACPSHFWSSTAI